MNVLLTTIIFLLLSFATFFLINRYVKKWLPESWLTSRWTMRILSVLFAFGAVYFITRWGFRPAVITINLRQNVDNPLRWINWFMSALSFGATQSCLIELLRTRVEEEQPAAPPSRRADML